ncbi:MAG: LURP-one-related family protein [Clostridia bacterium]|nr:LURP-one-related family protein [Clostridia bacterium]
MKLYIRQKLLSWKDRFHVKDENGEDRYYVEGEVWTLGKKLHVYDMSGREVAYIEQKITFMLAEYHVYQDGCEVAVIKQKFSWFHPKYEIEGLGWEVDGSFWLHEYEIRKNAMPIVSISKELMARGDSYELTIANPVDEIIALAVVLTIDCVIDSNND